MTTGDQALNQLKALARSGATNSGGEIVTQEYLARHVLESFLERLSKSPFAESFVIKGGVLLAAYDVRRATKDVDSAVVGEVLTVEFLLEVAKTLLSIDANDGVEILSDSVTAQEIQIGGDYPGFRLQFTAQVGSARIHGGWDVTTGAPIVPAPSRLFLPRLIGEPIPLLAYSREAILAEKGVTILERGIANTRWRDFVDIVRLAEVGFDAETLLSSARSVAAYRGVTLEPVSPFLKGFPESSQLKWSSWRRKHHLEMVSEENLAEQAKKVAEYLDPIFKQGPGLAN